MTDRELVWVKDEKFAIVALENLSVDGKQVAWLTKRPHYCDRGHWQVNCELGGIDGADRFPRYYMSYDVAKQETERFIRWRLWKQTDRL